MTVNIHGKEYKTVAERVNEIHNTIYSPSITTELVKYEDGCVIMKATVIFHEDGREANNLTLRRFTGYAEEKFTNSGINKTSALENCETSAIGRALAAAGFAGTEYASADEVANAINNQNHNQPANTQKKPPLNLVAFKKCIDIELKKYPDAHAAIEAIGAIRELTVEAEAMIQEWFTTQRPVNG